MLGFQPQQKDCYNSVKRSSRRGDQGLEHSKKQYAEVEYVAVNTKYFTMSFNSGFCLINVQALAVY
jgi:hypothetical protein